MIATGIMMIVSWIIFQVSFNIDRSRYRNCYFLFISLTCTMMFLISVSGDHMMETMYVLFLIILAALLIVPFFLMFNGFVMMKREGRRLPQLLSLLLGIIILTGEGLTFFLMIAEIFSHHFYSSGQPYYRSWWFITICCIIITIIYGSMSFLIFMIYTLFLHIVPRTKDFDYVIIHGCGLGKDSKVTKLLKDRLDKAIEVYHIDPTPPKLIPSGGQGTDESVPEAVAMRDYLLSQGIPAEDIILEGKSRTTLENLINSKEIIDSYPGRKVIALVSSNYHIYRALRYCRKIGLKCTGIGSHVAFYYWPSALIREYIAIHAEKKHAVIFILGWLLCIAPVLIPALFPDL